MLEEKLSRVLVKWRDQNFILGPPSTTRQVIDNFEKINKQASRDVVKFYTSTGGYDDPFMDNHLLSIWSLKQLVEENSFYKTNFVLFGDFLIFSHLYGFKYVNENISSVYSDFNTGKFEKIADSVGEFLQLYLTNPSKIGLYEE